MDQSDPRFKAALKRALKLLESQDQFESELQRKLEGAGVEPDVIAGVLNYLRERRVLNDQRTIINAVQARSGGRAVGREKLRASLMRQGAPEDILESTLKAITDSEQLSAMRELLERKFADRENRAKAGRFLLGRGFDEELVHQALESYFGSSDAP